MKFSAALTACVLLGLDGCSYSPQDRVVRLPADIVVSKPGFPNERFLPTNTGDLAFDTKSGSLCKTWNWSEENVEERNKTESISSRFDSCSRLYDWDHAEEVRHNAEMERLAEAKLRKEP